METPSTNRVTIIPSVASKKISSALIPASAATRALCSSALRSIYSEVPSPASRSAYCDLVSDVGEPAAEAFDLETSLWEVPEKGHACQRGIYSTQSYSSPYLLWAGVYQRPRCSRAIVNSTLSVS